jgi:hypothetical protein
VKFVFWQGKTYIVMYRELSGVLGEAAVSLATDIVGANASNEAIFPLVTKTDRLTTERLVEVMC